MKHVGVEDADKLLWPLCGTDTADDPDPWVIPFDYIMTDEYFASGVITCEECRRQGEALFLEDQVQTALDGPLWNWPAPPGHLIAAVDPARKENDE